MNCTPDENDTFDLICPSVLTGSCIYLHSWPLRL